MSPRELEQLANHAGQAVRDAAAFINGEMGKVNTGQIEEKHLNGLVSYVDRTAETLLVERLQKLMPEAGFVTEEETVENNQAEYQWVIDPLDGTTNFLYGVPHFSVSVALRRHDEILVGLVHHVTANEHFSAWQGGGAWLNGNRIKVSQREGLRQALVSTGFPYHNFSRADGWFTALRMFLSGARALRRFGSAALDLAYVACGRFDIFFEYGLNSWDVAGGILLVREAGGHAVDFNGGPNCMDNGELLACQDQIFVEALAIVKESFQRISPNI